MFTCGEFFSSIGWHCQAVQANGLSALYVSTPFLVGRTKPLGFFAIDHGDTRGLELTDDGTIMQALRVSGHPLEDRRQWRSFETLAQPLGVEIDVTGAFALRTDRRNLRDAASRWLQLYAAIVAWDAERLSVDAPDPDLEAEIQQVLAQVDAYRQLVAGPSIKLNNVEHRFSFQWGDTFVDASSAYMAATNSRLRKALLVQQTDPEAKMLIVVDDRKSIDRADREALVLNALVPAVVLRKLPEFAKRIAA